MFATESNCKYCKVQNGEVGLMGCEWGNKISFGVIQVKTIRDSLVACYSKFIWFINLSAVKGLPVPVTALSCATPM